MKRKSEKVEFVDGSETHDINMDVVIKFRGFNGGVIYEVKERVNCSDHRLQLWFKNLKNVIEMMNTISDKKVGGLKNET